MPREEEGCKRERYTVQMISERVKADIKEMSDLSCGSLRPRMWLKQAR